VRDFNLNMDSLVFENPELNNDSKGEQDQKVEQQDAIDFSNILIALFEDIATDLSDVSVEDLKSVYRRSESSFSKEAEYDVNIWGLARINMFIRQKTEGSIAEFISELDTVKVKQIQSLEFEDPFSSRNTEDFDHIDATQDWTPSKADFELAEQYVKKYDLKFIFSSLDELYIEEYKPLELELE
jgi:hypothetical protein